MTRSSELPSAYADTIGDLVLGWIGTLLAAALVHTSWRNHLPDPEENRSPASEAPVVDLREGGVQGPSARMAETLDPACAVTLSED